jgi:hypothetical protein
MTALLRRTLLADLYAMEASRQDDREWFEAHRPRQYRVRPYILGEMPELKLVPQPDRHWFVAVRQLEAGARMRRPFLAEGGPSNDEHVASRIFATLLLASQRP